MSDVNNDRGQVYMGAWNIWEIFVPFSQFCCKSKAAIKKNKVLKKKYMVSKGGNNPGQVSIYKWMYKQNVAYTYNGISLGLQKK